MPSPIYPEVTLPVSPHRTPVLQGARALRQHQHYPGEAESDWLERWGVPHHLLHAGVQTLRDHSLDHGAEDLSLQVLHPV